MNEERLHIAALYVGSSLLAPLKQAERDIESEFGLRVRVCAHNLGARLDDGAWRALAADLAQASIAFVFHVTDGENAARLLRLFDDPATRPATTVVINCMPDLMRRTRMGKLSFGGDDEAADAEGDETRGEGRARRLFKSAGSWMGEQARARREKRRPRHDRYLRLVQRLPALLKLVPNAGRLRDLKHYLQLFCYFLQPTPANIRSMLLYALKHYAEAERIAGTRIAVPPPESQPAVGIYHPDAPALFDSFDAYRAWYEKRGRKQAVPPLDPERTTGLLLMRTQIISGTRRHYDGLIRAVEAEGLAVIPAISTFMDNREACERFFVADDRRARVSQIVSLTGFSFVGGPAMNDSEAAVEFLKELNRPFRSAVSLDVQTVEAWRDSWTGLNPVQAGMQIAIPEIDGATEPFVYGGMPADGAEPVALEERCRRFARRLARWNRLRTAARADIRLAFVVFCFPPNKGNVGTAADLDVFPSLYETLARLRSEGYKVEVPESAERLRQLLLEGEGAQMFGTPASVAYRMSADEYERLCPYAREIEKEWGRAPGSINSFGNDLLIQGVQLGQAFVAVQPTFGYEGDPMRLLMARSGAPHHGFAALYTYLEKIFRADALVHVGTHGALEFMPGKQVGLSGECWPDRLVGELPHVYLYSVNNPSEGTIARRRSYAELVSYLTPPVEDAGVYRDLASLKELLDAYRQSADEREREELFAAIEERAAALHFD
ncbi:MAG TPA: cobaltochelatase subunit CobN [Pyrinomonadaceae bacterium]|nr:cobaltochelatase subunit CobN [Pyrinomonadaceae bacterium]